MFKTQDAIRKTQDAKGFTLIELIIVLIIVAVLGTLGLTQYSGLVERARGAEAKNILGSLRKMCAAYYMERATIPANADVGIGTALDQTPSACRSSHYFSYGISGVSPSVTITGTRCVALGKEPQRPGSLTLILTSNLNTGDDAWTGTGGYQ